MVIITVNIVKNNWMVDGDHKWDQNTQSANQTLCRNGYDIACGYLPSVQSKKLNSFLSSKSYYLIHYIQLCLGVCLIIGWLRKTGEIQDLIPACDYVFN